MRISPHGIAVAHYFENCVLIAYPDPGSKDGTPWTIGWGHTGPEVVKGLVWTQAQADAQFEKDLLVREARVARLVKVPLTQGQYDALVLFEYNTGSLASSTLLKLLNAGDYIGAQGQFARWNKNDGKVMRGLTRRRAAELALFLGSTGADAITRGVKAA
jgi:lysozyme